MRATTIDGFQEQVTGICPVSEHRAEVVEKVAEYLMYKETYSTSTDPIPDFSERVPPEIALELSVVSFNLHYDLQGS